MPTKSALSGARRADVTGLGVPEHHGDWYWPVLPASGRFGYWPNSATRDIKTEARRAN
jgi:hypothetical protein